MCSSDLVERIHASLKRTCPNGHPGSNPGTATNPTHVPVRLLAPHGKYITGTVRAFHEEARAVPLSGESGHTRVIQAHVPERACRFEACLRDEPHGGSESVQGHALMRD